MLSVSSQGGYVTKWQKILYQGSELKRTGIPILFPNYGAGGELIKHGFGRESIWQLEKNKSNKITLVLTNKNIDKVYQKTFPYQFQAKITVEENKNSLFYSLKVKNLGNKNMPICPGLHPYWAIPHDQKKSIKTDIKGFNASSFNWDISPPDNAYQFNGCSTIELPDKKIIIEEISPKPVINNIRVWSQTPNKPDFNFVCFEPLCGYDNDIVNNPLIIPPKKEFHLAIKFSVEFKV